MLFVVLALIFNTAVLALVTRRMVGVPVGWPRTILISAVYAVLGNSVLTLLGRRLGVIRADGTYVSDIPPELVGGILLLLLAWGVAFGVATLVVLEVIVPTGSLPDPVVMLRGLPARVRRQRRYVQILQIATKRGLGGWFGLGAHHDVDDSLRVSRALRLALSDAGVTFVKFGQMLSTRADLIGDDFARELGHLTSDVAPEPWERLRETLAAHLGRPIEEVFAEIDPTPLAAASVGQVHAGKLVDGSDIVIKIQRPGASAQVAADLDIIRRLARGLDRRTAWGRDLDVLGLVEGFAESLDEELDYRVEADNAHAVAASMPRRGDVRVPTVRTDLSGREVLVMERIHGVPITRARDRLAELTPDHRAHLAEALLAVVLRQIIDTGVFHADLHGGNVLLEDDGRLALLDLGSVGRLDRSTRDGVARLLLAVDHDDSIAATDALLLLLDRPLDLDDRALEREIGSLMVRARHGGHALDVFGELFHVVVRHGFSVPGQMAAVFRSLGALEGTLADIDPGMNLIDTAREVGGDLFLERLRPSEVRRTLESRLLQAVPLLERIPRRIDAVGRRLEDGDLSVRVRLLDDPRDRAFVTELVREVTTSIIAAACALLAAVFLVGGSTGPEVAPGLPLYPLLGATFLLFAFVLAARVLALALGPRDRREVQRDSRSDRPGRRR
ncbi:ABC1 kinase family protein [Mobilicoccus massiliensis]|uniref:ABC1 kinase family protein n=1 Tax=Mobilicoccus massiliensis TaxID=1522310 RepID=UPI001C3EAA6A|nr:AarF/UbiB family protein [Mobilicoccus massiliensis]